MENFITHVVEQASTTIGAHCERQRWDIDSDGHALNMVLTDLMVWAKAKGVVFGEELVAASETFSCCYSDEDFADDGCATCAASTETRTMPCDECGHMDGEA